MRQKPYSCGDCDKTFTENSSLKHHYKAIHLKVGVLSNIEPRLLHNAYGAYNYCGSKYHNVALHIESTDIKIQCETCNHITKVENYRFLCENCARPSKNIIQGEEMLIHKVEFED